MKVDMLESIERVMRERAEIYKEAYEETELEIPKNHWYNNRLLWFCIGAFTAKYAMTKGE